MMNKMLQTVFMFRITFIHLLFISFMIAEGFIFNDESKDQGISFIHDHGGTDQRYYIETIGAGVCLIDYDNDNDLDIYFCQGAPLPGWNKEMILENKLFRNENGRWQDVTSEAGV